MNRLRLLLCVAFALAMLCSGCAHTQVSKVGLISFGNLEGRTIPRNPDGPILQGSSEATIAPDGVPVLVYYLSDAARDALRNTGYDTLIDAEVTTKTGFMPSSNQILVKGKGLNSAKMPQSGGN
jgi:hypothetical protein